MIAMIPFTMLRLFCCGHYRVIRKYSFSPSEFQGTLLSQILLNKLFHSKEVHMSPALLLELPDAHQHNKGSEKS